MLIIHASTIKKPRTAGLFYFYQPKLNKRRLCVLVYAALATFTSGAYMGTIVPEVTPFWLLLPVIITVRVIRSLDKNVLSSQTFDKGWFYHPKPWRRMALLAFLPMSKPVGPIKIKGEGLR